MTEPPRVTILCAVSEIREFHAEDAFLMAVAAWLEDVGDRHKVDPEPAELVLHYEVECPTGECEDPGYHTVSVCWGCFPTYDGMEGRSLYPCTETKAALATAQAFLEKP